MKRSAGTLSRVKACGHSPVVARIFSPATPGGRARNSAGRMAIQYLPFLRVSRPRVTSPGAATWWTAAPPAGVDVKVETDRPNNEVVAGEPMNFKLTVTNRGTTTLYRLFAVSKSDNPMFDNKEFIIGKLEPGKSRTATAPAGTSRKRWRPAHPLALVIAARVGADLGVSAAQQRIVGRGVDGRKLDGRRGGQRRGGSIGAGCAAAASTAARAPRTAKASAEVQLSGLPGAQSFPDLLGVHRGIARRAETFADQDRGGFVGPVAAPALDVHGHHHVRPDGAEEADVIAHDILAAPFRDHFFGIEGIAEVDRAREVLLGPIEAVRRKQLGRAQHTHIAEKLRADFVLPAVAAVVLQVHGAQPHAVGEERQQAVALIVGMRRGLQERPGDTQLAKRQPERDVPAVLGHHRIGQASLRCKRRKPCSQGESEQAFQESSPRAILPQYTSWLRAGQRPTRPARCIILKCVYLHF